jgi:hypothetical protein
MRQMSHDASLSQSCGKPVSGDEGSAPPTDVLDAVCALTALNSGTHGQGEAHERWQSSSSTERKRNSSCGFEPDEMPNLVNVKNDLALLQPCFVLRPSPNLPFSPSPAPAPMSARLIAYPPRKRRVAGHEVEGRVVLPVPQLPDGTHLRCPFECRDACDIRIYKSREVSMGAIGPDAKQKALLFGHFCPSCNKIVQIQSKKPLDYRPFRFNPDGSFMDVEQLSKKLTDTPYFPKSWYAPCPHNGKELACPESLQSVAQPMMYYNVRISAADPAHVSGGEARQ